MTHSDIYKKFMIEYDKDNIASSYPSLTKREVATMLDKAYLALIAQKLTGNNPRRSTFEADVKAIEDLRPLITKSNLSEVDASPIVPNETIWGLPDDFLYFVDCVVSFHIRDNEGVTHIGPEEIAVRKQYVQLINHEIAKNFMWTTNNMPWIENPVCYLENDGLHILSDPESRLYYPNILRYIKTPVKFTDLYDPDTDPADFELNDTMAEELINLALIFATETVESPRFLTVVSKRPLEA